MIRLVPGWPPGEEDYVAGRTHRSQKENRRFYYRSIIQERMETF